MCVRVLDFVNAANKCISFSQRNLVQTWNIVVVRVVKIFENLCPVHYFTNYHDTFFRFLFYEKILDLVWKAFGYYQFPSVQKSLGGSFLAFFDTYGLIMAAAFHLTGRSFTESAMCILSRFPLSVSWKTLVGENLRYCRVVGKFAPFTLALLSVYCRMTFDNDKDILHYRVWLVKYIFHSCTFGDLKIFQMLLYPFGNLANID